MFNQINSKKTAKDVWNAITEIFKGYSTMVTINPCLKLQNAKCCMSKDMYMHFGKLANMCRCLASYSIAISDYEFALILVGSLPSTYDPTLSSILMASKLSKMLLEPNTIIDLITNDYDHCKLSKKKKHDNKDVVYYAGKGK